MNPNNYVQLHDTWTWPCGSATMNNWSPWDLEMHRNQENFNNVREQNVGCSKGFDAACTVKDYAHPTYFGCDNTSPTSTVNTGFG